MLKSGRIYRGNSCIYPSACVGLIALTWTRRDRLHSGTRSQKHSRFYGLCVGSVGTRSRISQRGGLVPWGARINKACLKNVAIWEVEPNWMLVYQNQFHKVDCIYFCHNLFPIFFNSYTFNYKHFFHFFGRVWLDTTVPDCDFDFELCQVLI